ncbi:uncharacterized protein FOMMEDRAFT_167576 [Fomitiporia mediterranea MF3/22]|uniref:uncharacterized protein n=1 Tax=Fomitiporia mediterranea (strain MF3/22) TaxID=694068 RepID=UPI0004409BEF|nr:uncharacterized protein FOMMEDRAFT_167576 [Fomitiporia mediterranea MF3/22]EJD04378.1 hypothetical protein FOMMEDRAFT_167576 [Fomitiporia mediterranea MF3/22]
MTDNRLLLEEELQVLQSIYPDYILEVTVDTVRLEVPIEFGTPRRVLVVTQSESALNADAPAGSSKSIPSLNLSYLPPILLTVKFTNGYPSELPPIITSVHATHSWLPSEALLASTLRETWSEGEGVLCNWVEMLRSGDFLNLLQPIARDDAIRLPHKASQPPLTQILEAYNLNAANKEFSQTSHPCSICFSSLKGVRCIQLECKHVFCRDCLQEFWSFCIAEGSVERVGCADPACVKKASMASEEEVRRVVSEKEVIRWKWLRTKKEIEKDPSIIHCPIPLCQAAVPKPPTDPNASSGWDRFRRCSACGFSFCSFCKNTWHGPLSECPKSVTHALIMEYLGLPEGSPGRAALERKFGKGVVLRLVKAYEDEKSTNEWLQGSTTSCPGCNIAVEKSTGCNHMMCVKCNQHFCYRCGARLQASNPYAHFSIQGSECYGKLFDINRSAEADGWQAIAMEGFEAL